MSRRSDVLELAVLGLLHDAPMHGYELRKQLNSLLGWGRAFSYGTLYPCLKDLKLRELIVEEDLSGVDDVRGAGGAARRPRIVYTLTVEGKEHFSQLVSEAGPTAWEDDRFGVHFAFFGRTDAATRLRILEGRRSRLQERVESFRLSAQRTRERLDAYTLELQRHGLDAAEREITWVEELIEHERDAATTAQSAGGDAPQAPR